MGTSSTAARRGDTPRVRELLATPRLSMPRHGFDPARFGPHLFPGVVADQNGDGFYTSDCEYDCGAWMGRDRSGGPTGGDALDGAFGPCPNNPRVPRIHPRTGEPTGGSYSSEPVVPETAKPTETVVDRYGRAPADACAVLQPISDATMTMVARLVYDYSHAIPNPEIRHPELARIMALAGVSPGASLLEIQEYPRGLWAAPLPEWLVAALWQRCPASRRWRLTDVLFDEEPERLEGGVVCPVCDGHWRPFESSEQDVAGRVAGREVGTPRDTPGKPARYFSRCLPCDRGWVYPDGRGIPSPRGLLRLATCSARSSRDASDATHLRARFTLGPHDEPVLQMLALIHVRCPQCLGRCGNDISSSNRIRWVSADCEQCAGTGLMPLVIPGE